jgi:hypothetical protein
MARSARPWLRSTVALCNCAQRAGDRELLALLPLATLSCRACRSPPAHMYGTITLPDMTGWNGVLYWSCKRYDAAVQDKSNYVRDAM